MTRAAQAWPTAAIEAPKAPTGTPMDNYPLPEEADAPTVPEPAVKPRRKKARTESESKPAKETDDTLVMDRVVEGRLHACRRWICWSRATRPSGVPPANDRIGSRHHRGAGTVQGRRHGHRLPPAARPSPGTRVELGPGVRVEKIHPAAAQPAPTRWPPSSVRLLAPIPGKSAVGVEVPNTDREMVRLADVLTAPTTRSDHHPMVFGIGQGRRRRLHLSYNLAKMPHLLVAGSTGSGKSSFINSMLVSLLAAGHAGRGPDDPDRPEDGGAPAVPRDSAPHHARDHRPEEGRRRAGLAGRRDGAALPGHERQRGPPHRRLQQEGALAARSPRRWAASGSTRPTRTSWASSTSWPT